MESSAELYSLIFVLIAITIATVVIIESVKQSSNYYERVMIQSRINSIALKSSIQGNCTEESGRITRSLPCIENNELKRVVVGE